MSKKGANPPKTLQFVQSQANTKHKIDSTSHIYHMLNRQQEAIENLLCKYTDGDANSSKLKNNNQYEKYSDLGLHESYIKPRSRTIDQIGHGLDSSHIKLKLLLTKQQKPMTRQSSPMSRVQQIQHMHAVSYRHNMIGRTKNQSITLPIVHQKKILSKSSSSKHKAKNKNDMNYYIGKDRAKLQHQLYKIYGDKKEYFDNNQIKWQNKQVYRQKRKKSRSKRQGKLKALQNTIQFGEENEYGQTTKQLKLQGIVQSRQHKQNQVSQFPQIQSDDQSQGQQYPLVYYERQFRTKMRAQCLEQLNFLYFTKNEGMRDWTDNLLALIEKHDKEITSIRIKSRYLHTFDDKFFSIGIFNSDDV